jgi:hypothetical protein
VHPGAGFRAGDQRPWLFGRYPKLASLCVVKCVSAWVAGPDGSAHLRVYGQRGGLPVCRPHPCDHSEYDHAL